ncbi:MAG: DUF4389 domain-containing protein [Alphaproteobacteria bacterium]|nr:DUF4389 domain-containing protein [Alphaproteobacteria bacterium]
MSQPDASYTGPEDAPQPLPVIRAPFPWERFLFSIAFAIAGWFAFWATIILAVFMWVMIAISREPHPDLKNIVNIVARYVWHCMAYVVLLRDDKPFPFGPLPKGDEKV